METESDHGSRPDEAGDEFGPAQEAMLEGRKSQVASMGRRKSSLSSRRRSMAAEEMRLEEEEVSRQMKGINMMEDSFKNKWVKALETHKEDFRVRMEKERLEREEMERNKSLVQEVRAHRDQKKVMSVQANIEEKKGQVEEFKKRRVTIVEKAKKEEMIECLNKRKWIIMMRALRNLQKTKKQELEEERKREFSMQMERHNSIKERMDQRREEQRKSQVEWVQKLSTIKEQKKVEKKRRKKRQHPPTESENRFKRMQREAKMRARREEMRKKKLEQELLAEKRKRYVRELARRAEVDARLDYLRKSQELNDFRQAVAMDRVRREFEAKVAVQKAEKQFSEKMVTMLKENDKYMKKLREKAAREKKKKASELKVQLEATRRLEVAERVEQHQKLVHRLAEEKGRQLADEEVKFLKEQEEQKEYNRWVSEQHHRKAQILRKQARIRECLRRQAAREQQQLKKMKELDRRATTLKNIEFLTVNKKEPLSETVSTEAGEEVRRQVIRLQRQHHRLLRQQALQRKAEQGAEVRKELAKERDKYSEERGAELQEKKERKALVTRPAQKIAWR
ncbi:trichohyalin-like [Cloeon dipterum]|uniref:trichohyalin-like n=1 Tax=Cloeon dipterum TaxID=197152 RepID=UPI00321FF9C4